MYGGLREIYGLMQITQDGADFERIIVVEVYTGDIGTWIMADPTYGCFVLDSADSPLSLPELRIALMEHRSVYLSADAHYNGERNLDQPDVLQYSA